MIQKNYKNYKHPAEVDTVYIQIDSIIKQIDTTEIEKVKVQVKYEEIKNEIISQSADSDYIFFTEYLLSKFPNYTRTTQAD